MKVKGRFFVAAGIILASAVSLGYYSAVRRKSGPIAAVYASPMRHRVTEFLDREHGLFTDPRFVVTSSRNPLVGMPSSRTQRWRFAFYWTTRAPAPQFSTFSPQTNGIGCSVHGMLMQCTDVTGIRFIIEREVAAGTIPLRHDKPLNGYQWSQKLTDEVRTNSSWWDPAKRDFRKEKVSLLTKDGMNVVVVSPELAREFRAKGFWDFVWK